MILHAFAYEYVTHKSYVYTFVISALGTVTEELRGSLNKFLDFFCMGTFIDSTNMKL